MNRAFIPSIADQLAETIPGLWRLRSVALDSMNYRLADLAELDERLEASLDVLRMMGPAAQHRCESALSLDSPGELFAATLFALAAHDGARIGKLCAVAEAIPPTRDGLHSAFSWASPEFLRGIVKSLLESTFPFERSVGIAASMAHCVNPGTYLMDGLNASANSVRSAALRAVGELGVTDAIGLLDGGEDDGAKFWAGWSAVLLGDRNQGLSRLLAASMSSGAHRLGAFRLALQAASRTEGHQLLQGLARDPTQMRWVIRGSGLVGDSTYVPWLIGHMTAPETARLAGEAFSLITGADLSSLGLEATRPEGFESGPNDDPTDPNVEMDPDSGLLWPDAKRTSIWWAQNASRFQAGSRYFLGGPVTREGCIEVLRNGYQRHRILAAHYLCLLGPGAPLFNTTAPSRRQTRALARLA